MSEIILEHFLKNDLDHWIDKVEKKHVQPWIVLSDEKGVKYTLFYDEDYKYTLIKHIPSDAQKVKIST